MSKPSSLTKVITGAVLLGLALGVTAAEKAVNVAVPVWGTQITATSAYSDAHAAANVADGSVAQGHDWLSADNAPLPQTVTFTFADHVRIPFASDMTVPANIQFHVDALSPVVLQCQVETNALVIKAVSGSGAARLTGFAYQNVPLSFMPERRPFSRTPVLCSPDPHPAIADALVEWDWRMQDGIQTPREPRTYGQAIEKLLRQTGSLVSERIAEKNLCPDERTAWEKLCAECLEVIKTDDTAKQESLWLNLHYLRRRIVFANPLFKTSQVLMVKHVPSVMSHQLTQLYGYCARPGGGLFILQEPGVTMRTKNITPEALPAGNFMTPELSCDAGKILFAYCPVEEAPASWSYNDQTKKLRYHIYELSLASGTVRQLTQGDSDNFFPVYLPAGDILFVSTLRGGYHRCGRGPCFVYTTARMGADGGNPRSVSFHETNEWDPCLLNDGRVIYSTVGSSAAHDSLE